MNRLPQYSLNSKLIGPFLQILLAAAHILQ